MVSASWWVATAAAPSVAATYVVDQQRRAQRQRADHQGDAGVRGPPHPGQVRPQRGSLAAGGADHDGQQRRGGAELGERGAERRAGDAEVEAVDEQS